MKSYRDIVVKLIKTGKTPEQRLAELKSKYVTTHKGSGKYLGSYTEQGGAVVEMYDSDEREFLGTKEEYQEMFVLQNRLGYNDLKQSLVAALYGKEK